MGKKKWTYGDVLELLENIAKATRRGDDEVLIKGNKKLERERAIDVKNLEDILFKCMKEDGIRYVRQYEHMYKNIK